MAQEARRGPRLASMRVKIQARHQAGTSREIDAPRPDYPLRVSSFFVSAGAHCLAIASLMLVSFPGDSRPRPLYDEFIKPHEHQVVFYDFRKQVPDVAPLKEVGHAPDPRGSELSKQTIIASSRQPKSEQVFISVPVPKVEIHQDLPVPLLVARLGTPLPPPPVPPTPKKFVPPPLVKQEPKLPIETPVLDVQVPPIYSLAVTSPLLMPTLTLPRPVVPPQAALEASTARSGNAQADIAVASLHPSQNANASVPAGERPGRFSKAPTQGAMASGDASASATLTVPDLTIRQPKQDPAPTTTIRAILYTEKVRSVSLATLSVPLRPSSRMIPQAVDVRFQGRNVYIIVIPMEHMPTYAGDWIMWFADRESKPGETPVVRLPGPLPKARAC